MPSLRTLPKDLKTFARYHLVRRSVDYPAREKELAIAELGLDFDGYIDQLRGFADRFDIDTATEIEYRGRSHPSLILRSRGSGPRLMVLAGVHGNEHAGLLAVPPILDAYAARGDFAVALTVIAPVNPVGAAELSRYNADGFDINRDFVRFETVEARVVRETIESDRPTFIVSLHEGPQDATFMFLNRLVTTELAERLARAMADGGTALAAADYFGRTLRPAGIAPMTRPMWILSKLWASTLRMKATGLYAEEHGIPEITLESSWRDPDRDSRVRSHVDLVAAVLDELS